MVVVGADSLQFLAVFANSLTVVGYESHSFTRLAPSLVRSLFGLSRQWSERSERNG